jgi:hypothetical protein
MTPQRRARIMALLVGFVAGLAAAAFFVAGTTGDDMPWSDWILEGGHDYILFTYPAGSALAGFLSAWGATRWRGAPATILVVGLSSLVGAIISVPVSLFLGCHYRGSSNMGCSGFFALRLAIETPFIWILLVIMTALLALLARRTGDQRPLPPVA